MHTIFNHWFTSFTEHEKILFEQALLHRRVNKNECLLKEGGICQSIYFITQGAFIQYSIKNEIDQNIIDLHTENEWMLNQQSFIRQRPSENIIEAYCDSEVYELTMYKLHELINCSPSFFHLASLLEPTPSRLQLFDQQLTPLEKYQFVLDHRPALLQFFPLKIIASYVKLTPETLSRVREKLSSLK